MSLSSSNRRKQIKKAQQAMPDVRVVEVVIGRSGTNPLIVGWSIFGLFAALSVAVYLATGQFFFLGVIPFAIVQAFASPARGIVIADRGVALMKRSTFSGNLTSIVAMAPHEGVQPRAVHGTRVELQFLHDTVWVTKKEEALLRNAIGIVTRGGPSAAHLPPSLV